MLCRFLLRARLALVRSAAAAVHGKREEAVAQFAHAREVDPLSMSADQAALVPLAIFRQNDQALEVAKKIVEKNPERVGAHFRVGEFYARLGRHREAIEAYHEAISLVTKLLTSKRG